MRRTRPNTNKELPHKIFTDRGRSMEVFTGRWVDVYNLEIPHYTEGNGLCVPTKDTFKEEANIHRRVNEA